jgi:hypothetical protein
LKNAAQTIGNLIDKQSVSFISSIGDNGFPYTKAMLPPRKRDLQKDKVICIPGMHAKLMISMLSLLPRKMYYNTMYNLGQKISSKRYST